MSNQEPALIQLQLRLLIEDTPRRISAVAIATLLSLYYIAPLTLAVYFAAYGITDYFLRDCLRWLGQDPTSRIRKLLVQLAAFSTMSAYLALAVLLWLVPGIGPKVAALLFVIGGMLSVLLVRTAYLPMTIANSLPLLGVTAVIGWIERHSLPPLDLLVLALAMAVMAAYFAMTLLLAQRFTHELWRARDTALTRAETQKRFLATMSHELRTPLNGILGIAQTIAADHPGLGADSICDSAREMAVMVDDLLDNAAIEAGALRIRPEPASLADLMNRIEQRWQPEFAARGLTLGLVLEPALPDWVLVDRMRLTQCVSNLIGNALRMTAQGGVTLTLSSHPKGLMAEVTDTGPGLPEGAEHRLFRPFDSLDPEGRSGTGLGLSICRGLALAMGGDLTYSRAETGGCRFCLTLSAPATSPSPDPVTAAPDAALLAGAALLVVDDIATNRLVLRLLLASLGVNVIEAASGAEVMQQFADPGFVRPDAILMDIRMPGLSGFDTLSALRKMCYDGPVIAVSADAAPQERAEAVACGFDGYLTKPVEAVELTAVLCQALGQSGGQSRVL